MTHCLKLYDVVYNVMPILDEGNMIGLCGKGI